MTNIDIEKRNIFLNYTTDFNYFHEHAVDIERINEEEVLISFGGNDYVLKEKDDEMISCSFSKDESLAQAYVTYLEEEAKEAKEAWVCPGWDELGQYGPRSLNYANAIFNDYDELDAELEELTKAVIPLQSTIFSDKFEVVSITAKRGCHEGTEYNTIEVRITLPNGKEQLITFFSVDDVSVDNILERISVEEDWGEKDMTPF